eukprot:COSAG02_NODE_1628_length_11586_cov_3.954644_5_plen_729_part_00
MELLLLLVPLLAAGELSAGPVVVEVAPGGTELAACLASGATRCHLLPGVHREAAVVSQEQVDGVGNSDPVEITGAPGSVLSGTVPVPGPWTQHKGCIFKTQLPASLRGQDIQQAWAGQTWLPEARWPNTNLTAGGPATAEGGPLSLSSWATTYGRPGQSDNCTECTRLRKGVIVDPELAKTGIDFTGALVTLNVGFRFLTWTRRVLSHEAGSSTFTYNQTTPKGQKGLVGGSGHYLDKGADNRYFLSGVLDALDAPGEHFIDARTSTMYLWMPDSGIPSQVEVKVKDYCARGRMHLANLNFWGCTFLLKGDGLKVDNVSLTYPSFHKTIDPRNPVPGPIPAQTLLHGNDGSISRMHLRYAQNGGLKIVGDRNVVSEFLAEDMTWLGSMDFAPLMLGFGFANPTAELRIDGSGNITEVEEGDEEEPSELGLTPWTGVHVRGVDPTLGNDNAVRHATLRRFGEMGVVTSQRSNELSYLHVHDGGLIGLDNACVHADNTFVDCMNYSLPAAQRTNCTKEWHHSWVHDCREKGVRGDDFNLNLTLHHLVVWNLGEGRDGYDRNDEPSDPPTGAATGVILKGDYNRAWACTVFNTSKYGQGDLCATTKPLGPTSCKAPFTQRCGFPFLAQQNLHSLFLNSAAKLISGQGGPRYPNASFEAWKGIARLDEASMQLRDPGNFDFRPTAGSPLVGAGETHPPEVKPRSDGRAPDVGAYQADDANPWRPGCTFHLTC